MKKLGLTICGLLILMPMFAQEFAPVGAKWYYTEQFAFSGDISYLSIESVGDTLIKGKNCNILDNNGGLMCAYHSNRDYVYTEDSIVYFYVKEIDTFQVLYNFKANKGDTWLTIFNSINELDTLKITIDSISSVNINGYNLISQLINYSELDTSSGLSYNSNIIERIGDTYFLFNLYSPAIICDENFSGGLRCYEDSEFGFYSTGIADSCTYTYDWTRIENNNSDFKFKFYPNPTKDWIEIICNIHYDYKVTIFNLLGEVMLIENISGDSKLDLSDFNKGIYILKVSKKDKIFNISKIVKN